jgi:N-acetylglucosaminyl-diphospho-decaprenol L-rhamnosyltransferase
MDLCLRARAAGVPTILDRRVRVLRAGGQATRRADGGEPDALLARRRRAVVAANRGRSAQARDDLAQALTFTTRGLARLALGRPAEGETAQLTPLPEARA